MPKLEEEFAEAVQERHEKALTGLESQLDLLVAALAADLPLASPFRNAKLAMETLLLSASDGDKLRWADIALAVARVTTGELQAEAFALAYRLVHPLT